MNTRIKAGKIFRDALKEVDPSFLVKAHVKQLRSFIATKNFSEIKVAGFGKAAYQMAMALEEELSSDQVMEGVIVTKYGHAKQQPSAVSGQHTDEQTEGLMYIKVYEAGHPIPDENGVRAAEEIVKLLRSADESTLVICLVSGGGSALFVCPYEGITLAEKQTVTDLLMKAGADITELNAVRKHISMVKGGRLAEIASPAEVVALMISDVVGDSLDVIASGPTVPDTSRFSDALDAVNKYGLGDKLPASVMDVIKKGAAGEIPETPKKGALFFSKVNNIIIGSNKKALDAAVRSARALGYVTEILSSKLVGDAHDAAMWLAEKAIAAKTAKDHHQKGRLCLISGGETTVTVKGKGKGGRNTELALVFAKEIEGFEGITMLSAGTDGTDGPTDAAGAVVDCDTVKKAVKSGLAPDNYLEDNDSYDFFKEIDSLVITGPTGTNVMDIQIILIE